MWIVVNAVYKKSKVSNSSSGMNKCASVTLRAKDAWLADLKANLYGVLNGFDYSLTPKRSCKTWVRLPGTPPKVICGRSSGGRAQNFLDSRRKYF